MKKNKEYLYRVDEIKLIKETESEKIFHIYDEKIPSKISETDKICYHREDILSLFNSELPKKDYDKSFKDIPNDKPFEDITWYLQLFRKSMFQGNWYNVHNSFQMDIE